ncbi:MAG: hypothetical protein ABI758_04290 [Candidatus Woesebacteria bacterium]
MQNPVFSFVVSVLTIAVIINLVFLNYAVFHRLPQKSFATPLPISQIDSCGETCRQQIQVALANTDAKIATLTTKVQNSIKPQSPVASTPVPGVKEFFIPMGSGSTQKSDWEDVAGTDVYIDTKNFPGIKQSYFEVSMHIPTKNGTMYARLYNVTDKHPIWNSDVLTDLDTSTFTTSKITLDPGNKQYRVQMKTTLQYPSILDSARVKILIQ